MSGGETEAACGESDQFSAALLKEGVKNRPVTPIRVLAVAAYGKIGLMRESCEQVEESCRFRLLHLGPELALERFPRTLIGGV